MTNSIIKAGRRWAVIDDETGEVHAWWLKTRREAENWKRRGE